MKLGKIYKCIEDEEYIQMTTKYPDDEITSYFNIVSLSKGVTIRAKQTAKYYEEKLTKVSKKEREWFLDSIVAGKVLPQEDYKSKKDQLIDELVEQNKMLVLCLEDLCPGFKETYLIEVTKEI